MKRILLCVIMVSVLMGCAVTTKSIYPGTGIAFDLSEDGVQILGKVIACQGGYCINDETGRAEWPLSLVTPPPASTYQAALRKKAAKIYNVPEGQIILGEIDVGFYTEIVGTIRGWTATSIVGRKMIKSFIDNN